MNLTTHETTSKPSLPNEPTNTPTAFARWLESGALMLWPARIEKRLHEVAPALGLTANETPNRWQIQLGVARMLHRVLYRSESIGSCEAHPVRDTWLARLLHRRRRPGGAGGPGEFA